MEHANLAEVWGALSASVCEEMATLRKERPKATLREIEEELDARLSGLRAQMLADLAHQSPNRDWSRNEPKERPRCPQCSSPLQSRGQHERALQTQGGAEVKLTRSYGTCPQCGSGLFPPG
jgi:hypothetical protein